MILANRLRMKIPSGCGGDPNCDPYWDNVVLLLHGDGADGSTNIVDSSQSGHAITVNGGAQISTAQSKFGGGSVGFDGTGNLTVTDSSLFDLGLSDEPFTVEAFLRPQAYEFVLLSRGGGFGGWNNTTGHQYLFFIITGGVCYSQWWAGHLGSISFPAAGNINLNTWQHVAIVFGDDNYLRMYVDGAQKAVTGTPTVFSKPASSNKTAVGSGPNDALKLSGHIDELRITKGVARYTADFTPPTAPFSNTGP